MLTKFPIPTTANRDILVNTMVMEYGMYDLFPDNPTVFQIMNDMWWSRNLWTFQKMLDTMSFDYDPIENYRRYEDGWENNDDTENRKRTAERDMKSNQKKENEKDRTEGVIRTRTEKENESGESADADEEAKTSKRNQSGNYNDTETNSVNTEANNTQKENVSAYNTEGYVNANETITDANGTENRNRNLKHEEGKEESEVENKDYTHKNDYSKEKDNSANENIDEKEKIQENENLDETLNENETENVDAVNNRKKKYGALAHGNIGVTTTQQMIQQEREIVNFDVYLFMAKKWAHDFCVMVS